MTPRRSAAVPLLVAGAILWAFGLFADPLGVGGVSGFNWKQVIVAEAGAAAILLGVLALRPSGGESE